MVNYSYQYDNMYYSDNTSDFSRDSVEKLLFTGENTRTDTPAMNYNMEFISNVSDIDKSINVSSVTVDEDGSTLIFRVELSNVTVTAPETTVPKNKRVMPIQELRDISYNHYKIDIYA